MVMIEKKRGNNSVIVNFICPLDSTKGFQIAGRTEFLGMSVMVFPEEISI